MNREEALQKIKKCMALGKSAEPHEAAAALRQAQKLMELHGLSECDVSLADVSEEAARSVSSGYTLWEVLLAQIVCNTFGCDLLLKRDPERAWRQARRSLFYIFIGVETAPALAAYAHAVLARQCAKARSAYLKKQPSFCPRATKTARGDAFAQGWVLAAADVVQRFVQPEQNKKLVLEYIHKHYPDLEESFPRNSTRGHYVNDSHLCGRMEGQNAQLHHGVHAPQQKQLTGTASSL